MILRTPTRPYTALLARIAAGLLCAVLALAYSPRPASAQGQPDVVRGRVTDDSAHAIPRATVIVTRGPDRLVQTDTTDSTGVFSLKFDPGTGDYLVYVTATGFSSVRRRVQREGSEHDLVANFILRADLNRLATINIKAAKPVRATNSVSPYTPEIGASEKWEDGVNGQISPTVTGDLNAVAGTMSNVTMTATGPSILGSGGESNLTTLNGMGMAAGAIPRAANTNTRVTGATFDPTRGGFTGANIDVQLSPGSRFFQERRGFLTLSPSALQFTDAIGRAAGARTGLIRGSLGADGELIRDALTYNVAVDLAHSVTAAPTLLNADNGLFLRAGVAPDSVTRALGIASPLGLAPGRHGIPDSQKHTAFSWLGRLDDTRDTLATRALTSYATVTQDGGVGFSTLNAPSTAGEQRQQALGAQLTLGNYVGAGGRILTETRFSASTTHTQATPYEQLPSASVLVLSPSTGASINAGSIMLGGGLFATDDSRWTLEGSNTTTWNTNGKRNHFKGLLWARADGLRQSAISNQFGSYSFNSLGDLANGNADSYSRTLTQPDRSGSVWNAAAALAHQWSPSRTFNVLYGARLEADGFASAPPGNPALETALGVRTDIAPMRFHLSPRAGFSYMYSKSRDNGNGMNSSQIGSFYRSMTGVIRGGIGEFRDLLRPDILANASAATGLPGGTSSISCVGAAVPAPEWSMFQSDPSSIPTRCLDGSGLLTDYSPAVSLISPSYDVPHSWRGSLDWISNINKWVMKVSALGSYDLSQPGTVDVNFTGTPQFTLASEGGRPVYVSTAAIDPSSGTVSPTQARKSPEFGRVGMRTSDLRGYGAQLTATVSPDVFKLRFRPGLTLFTSLSYTLQESRRQYRGFDGAAFGDPRLAQWAPSASDARNILVYTFGFDTPRIGSVTLFARAQSGLPFTPIVQGDVNGDGLSGDRAFIPNPAVTPDAALAGQLRSLISNGSGTARKCLLDNLGRPAPLNGCRGPWTELLNLQWRPPLPSRWMGRVRPNIYFENVLGGIDQLVHGSNNLRGWGSQSTINPVLLVPHGFNPATKQFQYTVNPRFADTRPVNSLTRNPFRITLDFSVDLSVNYDVQELRRAVEPVKSAHGYARRSADSLTAFYLSRTSDIHKMLIANSDSLFLTKPQIAALQHYDSVYSARVRAVFIPLGQFLAAREEHDPGKAELDSVKNAQKTYWKIFWEQPEVADSAVNPAQRELMPMLKNLLAVPKSERDQAHWYFGNPVTLADRPKAAAQPGGPQGIQIRR